ncbi:hypothetical protein BGZ63DRAFT_376356 [Mariannaea sp. PMI_226]|nr:hypothetical protein BGZ63DRAFT_376356 [Mariannaea sp. PMI_226]
MDMDGSMDQGLMDQGFTDTWMHGRSINLASSGPRWYGCRDVLGEIIFVLLIECVAAHTFNTGRTKVTKRRFINVKACPERSLLSK